jgi:L-ascorbate oxidase
MECVYDFTVEYYSILTRNCFNCTFNSEDCDKPHCVVANGVKRAIKTVNKMLPGPYIQVCKDDTIVVNVQNDLYSFESTTIHWHGIHQRGSPHMDGVGMITQCPITPHTNFQYRFEQ